MFEKILETLKTMRGRLDEHIKRTEDLERDFAGIVYPRVSGDHVAGTDAGGRMLAESMGKSAKAMPLGVAVAELIKERPAKTANILQMLLESGRKVGGKRPMVTLYSALVKCKLVKRLPNKEWRSLL